MLLEPAFVDGIRALARRGLTFDTALYFHQIPELTQVAHRVPDALIVLDHLGFPVVTGPYAGRASEVRETWARSLSELVRCPNVVLKLGGIGLPIFGLGFDRQLKSVSSADMAAASEDLILEAIALFGPDRCMFESNFPPDEEAVEYSVLWNGYKRIVSEFTAVERNALFRDTAASVYNIAL
jgi:predicted TIM-barrel fold metal-dependent hydrolase